MKVQVKILMNRAAINEAQNINAQNEEKRRLAEANKKKNIKQSPLDVTDVEVPAEEIVLRTLMIDSSRVILAGENELGMISIIYQGTNKDYDYNVVKTEELMAELEKRFA